VLAGRYCRPSARSEKRAGRGGRRRRRRIYCQAMNECREEEEEEDEDEDED